RLGYTFPLLSDPETKVIRRYDVLHPGAGPKGADIARPAEFLLDSNSVVRWVNLTDNIAVRARPAQVLETLNQPSPPGQSLTPLCRINRLSARAFGTGTVAHSPRSTTKDPTHPG